MSETDEIAAWLRAQAEADLAAAKIISDGGFEPERWDTWPPGQVNPPSDPGSAGVSAAIGQEDVYTSGWVQIRAWDHEIGSEPDEDPAPGAVPVLAELGRRQFDHVIRHDPRTEAARAESVLAVLDDYVATLAVKEGTEAKLRAGEEPGPNAGYLDALRELAIYGSVVRLLAAGYRHREGYKESWA